MSTATKVNYTEAQVAQLHDLYAQFGSEGLDRIAESLGKSVRSVRAKLVRDGLYVAPTKTAVSKVNGPSKKEILREFEAVSFDASGLEGATKEALQRVLVAIRAQH